MDPIFGVALFFAAGREGGNRLNFLSGPSSYHYETKKRSREVAGGSLCISAHVNPALAGTGMLL